MADKNLIKIYVDANSAKRVDIIIKNYSSFIGIVEGYPICNGQYETNDYQDT